MILCGTRIQRNGHGECGLPLARSRSHNKQTRLCSRVVIRDATGLAIPDQQPLHVVCAGRRAARLPRADLPEGERRS